MFERVDVPLVVDADGLNALAAVFDRLPRPARADRPHPARGRARAGCSASTRPRSAAPGSPTRATRRRSSRAIVVLKGDDTLVAAPAGRVAVSRGGAPALATAGTGDVLSGVLGAMLAKGLAPAHAACAAVYVHLAAGRLAAEPHGPDAVIASDVVAALPAALNA